MANISTWSTTAASNNSNPPDGFPENMAPSAVNDAARELMASVRTWYQDAEWVNLGYTHTYASGTSFTIAGADYTTEYHVGRRLRAVGSSTGTIYGTITASSFSTDTTVTIAWDSGSLSNESLTVSMGAASGDNSSLPGVEISEDDWTHQGNVTVEGTLGVTGAVTLSSTLAVTGTLTAGTLTASTAPLPRSWLAGLALSNDTDTDHDIAIAVGAARDDSDAADLRLAATLTKQIDATWSVGDDAGGLDTGAVANSTWYAVWLIRRSDTGVVDALFSTSGSSPTMPTNYDQKRRIGWVKTNGSANICQFTQTGDVYYFDSPSSLTLDNNGSVTADTDTTITVTNAPASTIARLHLYGANTGNEGFHLNAHPTSVATASHSVTAAPLTNMGQSGASLNAPSSGFMSMHIDMQLDASSQFHVRSSSGITLRALAVGWIDRRGRDD